MTCIFYHNVLVVGSFASSLSMRRYYFVIAKVLIVTLAMSHLAVIKTMTGVAVFVGGIDDEENLVN
jgi:hypothetical protein